MPYKFKGARDCTQSSGKKGKYLTIKKDGTRKCYKSEDNYKSSMAWGHGPIKSGDEKEEPMISESIPRRNLKFAKEHLKLLNILNSKQELKGYLQQLE